MLGILESAILKNNKCAAFAVILKEAGDIFKLWTKGDEPGTWLQLNDAVKHHSAGTSGMIT